MLKHLQGIMLCLLAFLLVLPPTGYSASLPKTTQEMLKNLKLEPSILADVDKNLNVPQEWIEEAKKEGKLKVRGSPATRKELTILHAPFKERYPFIDIDYYGANRQGRTIKTLMAYKAGRIVADLVLNVATYLSEFEKAGALENLSDLPALIDVPEGFKGQAGEWAGLYKVYWCIAYNTKLVNKRDLPKRWEDLLTNPKWRGGNIALGNRPNLWAVNLWMAKGERWTKDFLTRLFTEVKPQLRKEGMSALVQLAAAGEFHAVIPANPRRTYQSVLDGAPVSFACPEPVPTAVGASTVILKGAPNVHAAKIYLNWLLSKEGQIALYVAGLRTPIHRDIQRKEFLPFADQTLGKKEVFRDQRLDEQITPQLFEFWNPLWLGGGGTPRRR